MKKNIIFSKGFKDFLIRTLVLVGFFLLMQIVISNVVVDESLPYNFKLFSTMDLVKTGFVVLILFFLFVRKKLFDMKEYGVSVRQSVLFGVLTILSVCNYFWLKKMIVLNAEFVLNYVVFFEVLRYLALFIILVFLVLAVYGMDFVKDFIRKFKKEIIGFFFCFFVIYFLLVYLQRFWSFFANLAGHVAYFVLSLIDSTTVFNNSFEKPILIFKDFMVGIAKPCSGTDSILLFVFLYVIAVAYDWEVFNKFKAVLIFVPAVVSVFFLNVLRILLIIFVGAYWSRGLALGIIHANLASLIFIIYFAIFWKVSYRWMKR